MTAERPRRHGYVGWLEFVKEPGMTTHIAYMHEDGYPYFPEGGSLTEWDLRAAEAAGRTWPLVPSNWLT
jgi:hypothetical protein